MEVEEEITLPLEEALQRPPTIDNITSNSSDGLSQIRVETRCIYRIHSRSNTSDGLASLEGMLVGRVDGQLVYLRDVATLSRGYADPPSHLYRFDGRLAFGLWTSWASTVSSCTESHSAR